MAGSLLRHRYTLAEYLAFEESSNVKHEYFAGEIYGMAGGTPDHAALAMAFGAALLERLRGRPCRVFSSDLRIRVLATGLVTYPDVTVVCGPLERDPESRTTVTNPLLVAEVTSDSTEEYDRGDKREHCRQIPSLKEYVLISHREPRVEVWRRGPPHDNWVHGAAGVGDTIHLASLDCALPIDEIYRGGLEDGGAPPVKA